MNSRLQHLDLIASAPDGIKRLRELILELAVRGKLVPQDPSDEPASELLKRIQAEKAKLVSEGKIKKDKPLPEIGEDEKPFELPAGWEWARLVGLTLQITDGTHHTPRYLPDGVAFISVKDIDGNTVSFDECKHISDEEHRQINLRCNPERGDMLLCRIGTLGRPTLVDTDRPFSLFVSVGLLKLPKTISISAFMHAVMRSPFLVRQYDEIKAGGSHTNKLNLADIPTLRIPVPPFPEQNRIVAKVDELMALCDQLEAQQSNGAKAHATLVKALLDALTQSPSAADFATQWQRIAKHFDTLFCTEASVDALKQAILQLAVMGKLVPQNPDDEPASELLKRIQAEKAKLVAEGKIKKDKPLPAIGEDEKPFELPVGWEWIRFIEMGEFRGGKTPSTNNPAYWDGNIPWVSPKDMRPLTILDTEDYVTELAVRDGLGVIPANSVLIVVRSGILRRMVPVAINSVECTVNQDLKALCLVMPEMVNYVQLMVRGFQRLILEKLTKTGMTVESIIFDEFSKHPFPFPPLPEQHRIVAKVDELMALCDQLTNRLKVSRERSGQYATAATQSALDAA